MKSNNELIVEKMFDVYCRTILKNRAINYHMALSRIQRKEVHISTWHEIRNMSEDVDFRKKYYLRCNQECLIIRDETLYAAIKSLPPTQRKIIILYYGGEMSDANISKIVCLPKSTVNFKRNKAIRILRDTLRVEDFYE